MKLSAAAQLLKGQIWGSHSQIEFTHVSTDTRTLRAGTLFVALQGPHFDGHHFLAEAQQKNAAAALTSRLISSSSLPQLQVVDTQIALGQLAAYHREQFHIPVIAVTGSCGKTTVKTMLASILQQCGPTLASVSSFNNEIGVPLTLLNLDNSHQYAVIEMGTNHFGDIAYLTEIAKPTIAVITNAAAAHLEGLGTVAGVARAKGEIFQGLASDGIAILNADDEFAVYWQGLIKPKKIFYFGRQQPADFTAKNIRSDEHGKAHFLLVTPQGEIAIHLPLLGMHNVMNALAATAAAHAVNAPLMAIKAGLETTSPVSKRLVEYLGYHGAQIIDDTYNANPLSMQAALEILAARKGEKILVLADMKELGAEAKTYHSNLGLTAKHLGIEHLYTFGELSEYTSQSFGANAQHFNDQLALITTLKKQFTNQTVVLIKGSRSMRMEQVVAALIPEKNSNRS